MASVTTAAPEPQAGRDPQPADARRGTHATKPKSPGEDTAPPDGDPGPTQAQPAAGNEPVAAGEVTVPVGDDPVQADATQPTELVDEGDGDSDDDEQVDAGDDEGDDRDDDDDNGLPLDVGTDGR